MNINHLRYFITAAQCLNFSEAAKLLFITQPTLSYCISTMEKTLGTALFQRTTKSISLTNAGEVFLESAKQIVDMYDASVHKIQTMKDNISHSLRVAFLGTSFTQDFPQWINTFRSKYPEVDLSLQVYSSPQFFKAYNENLFDVGFARKLELTEFKNIRYIKLNSDRMMVAISKSNPLAEKDSIKLDELGDLPFIIVDYSRSPNFYNKIMQVCTGRSYTVKIRHLADSPNSIYPMVSSGIGVAIVPSSSAYATYSNIKYLNIDDRDYEDMFDYDTDPRSLNIEAGVIWNKNNKNPNIKLLLDSILEN